MPVSVVSLGDYVLNGGEVAVLAIVEAVARLLPGVLGNAEIAGGGVATRTGCWSTPSTPSRRVLARARTCPRSCSPGHHGRIARWRRDERLRRTATRRPDLVARLDPAALDARDRAVLEQAQGGFQQVPPAVAD